MKPCLISGTLFAALGLALGAGADLITILLLVAAVGLALAWVE